MFTYLKYTSFSIFNKNSIRKKRNHDHRKLPTYSAFGVKNERPDLHLSAGLPPMMRRAWRHPPRINLPEMSSGEAQPDDHLGDQRPAAQALSAKHGNRLFVLNCPILHVFVSMPSCPTAARPRVFRNHSQHRTHLRAIESPAQCLKKSPTPPRAGLVLVNRPHRLGQIHHAGGNDQLYQRNSSFPHPNHRRPD